MGKRMSQDEFLQRFNDYTKNTVTLLTPYINKKTKIRVKCNICNYEWDIAPASILYHDKYSFRGCPECKYTICECSYCHKSFKRLKSELSEQNFCSRECGNRYKNINRSDFTDGVYYRRNAFLHNEHKCAVCGWNKDERVLEVHHIDENHNNNNISNLIILCPTCHKFLTLHLCKLEELSNFIPK